MPRLTVLFLTLILGMTTGSLSLATAEEPQRFENATAGIALLRPAGWQTLSVADLAANRDQIELDNAEFQEMIQRAATAPLFVFAKYPEPHEDLNPTIQVIVRPLGALKGEPATKILEAATAPLSTAFSDFTFVDPIQKTTVAGHPAAYMKGKYTLRNTEGGSFPTYSRLWIVPRATHMFVLGMAGPQEGPDVSEAEFGAVLDSLEID